MRTHTRETQSHLTPDLALEILKEGNARFVNNITAHRDLLEQKNETRDGQFPFAAILSCIDSRTSAELIFDQGLGDIFSIRIAGNILNDDILGSMEFACKMAGSKLVVVLGHTNCGAIEGACNEIQLGHVTSLLNKIKPAIEIEKAASPQSDCTERSFIEKVALQNVFITVQKIREQSPVLAELEKQNGIRIVGALYNLETGKVVFY
jgi:carbonic anhydrase